MHAHQQHAPANPDPPPYGQVYMTEDHPDPDLPLLSAPPYEPPVKAPDTLDQQHLDAAPQQRTSIISGIASLLSAILCLILLYIYTMNTWWRHKHLGIVIRF